MAQLGLTPEEEAEDQADVAEMSPEEIATNEAAMQVADEAMAEAEAAEEKEAEAFAQLKVAVAAEQNAEEETRAVEEELAAMEAVAPANPDLDEAARVLQSGIRGKASREEPWLPSKTLLLIITRTSTLAWFSTSAPTALEGHGQEESGPRSRQKKETRGSHGGTQGTTRASRGLHADAGAG